MLDEHGDKLSFVDMDSGYEKAIKNFLIALSKKIEAPKSLTKPEVTLFEHSMFKGKKLRIKKDENIKHLKAIGWDNKASSFQFDDFKGRKIEFGCGTHYIRSLKIHKLGDKLTSCKWSKI